MYITMCMISRTVKCTFNVHYNVHPQCKLKCTFNVHCNIQLTMYIVMYIVIYNTHNSLFPHSKHCAEERRERRGRTRERRTSSMWENFFDVGSSKSVNRGNCGGFRVKRQKEFTKDRKSN